MFTRRQAWLCRVFSPPPVGSGWGVGTTMILPIFWSRRPCLYRLPAGKGGVAMGTKGAYFQAPAELRLGVEMA